MLKEDSEDEKEISEDVLNRYRVNTSYWLEDRHLDQATIDLFQLGYDAISDAVTIPVRDINGHLYGVTRRFLSDVYKGARYKYPYNFSASRNLFASWLSDTYNMSTVSMHEGAIDAMRLWKLGIPATALYGSSISPYHIRLLLEMGVKTVVYFGDSDSAGQRSKQRAKGWWIQPDGRYKYKPETDLTKHFIMKHVVEFNNCKDAGDMTDLEIIKSWESAEPYRFTPFKKRKIYS